MAQLEIENELAKPDLLDIASEAQSIEDELIAILALQSLVKESLSTQPCNDEARVKNEPEHVADILETAPVQIQSADKAATNSTSRRTSPRFSRVDYGDTPTFEDPLKKERAQRGSYFNDETLKIYLEQIGKYPLLNGSQEEQELAIKIEKAVEARNELEKMSDDVNLHEAKHLQRIIRQGDQAKERFIQGNLRLVVSVARKYPKPEGMELLDLIQEGNLGLEHAVDMFEWRKGFKFSTYATFWIRQRIGRAIDQKGRMIRLPGNKSAELRAARRESVNSGSVMTTEQAELHKLSQVVRMDQIVGDGETSLGELLADPSQNTEELATASVAEDDVKAAIGLLMKRLSPRQQQAVLHRFGFITGEKASYREVGKELGITAEAARRLVQAAVGKLRESKDRELFKDAM